MFVVSNRWIDLHLTDYLGSTEYSYTLNFSKPASPVFAQMFKYV